MAKLVIHSSHFKHNLDLISQHIQHKEKLALVLKDNAYGHGLLEIAKLAKEYGIKSVFVKNEMEALKIHQDFQHITALYGEIADNAPNNIYQTIHSLQALKTLSPHRKIELKVNTGMNRNGIELKEVQEAIKIILKRNLQLIGVFSHNGYGDDGGIEMEKQHQKSQEVKEQITHLSKKLGFALPRFHFLSSSGTLRSANVADDLVRIGIAGYGYLCASLPIALDLKPVASLWAKQISQRKLAQNERVGYSGAGILPYEAIVSTYDLGYGDGLFRLNETYQEKLLCACGEEILPRMSMDCFSCLSQKKEICIFEDARDWANYFKTTPYDILVKLSSFIPKEIV